MAKMHLQPKISGLNKCWQLLQISLKYHEGQHVSVITCLDHHLGDYCSICAPFQDPPMASEEHVYGLIFTVNLTGLRSHLGDIPLGVSLTQLPDRIIRGKAHCECGSHYSTVGSHAEYKEKVSGALARISLCFLIAM